MEVSYNYIKSLNFNSHSFESYLNNFHEVMPQIYFNENESLIDTLKKSYQIIGEQCNSNKSSLGPYYLSEFLKNHETFYKNYFGYLENVIRHQGSIYTETYYWLIFMIELLNREDDAICSSNSKMTLDVQIYYENFVIQPLINFYQNGSGPNFYSELKGSSIFHNIEDLEPELYFKEKQLITSKVIKKMVNLVESHILRIKDKLIEKCKNEQITPIRTLWLYTVPLTFDEFSDMIKVIENKYIRVSLFWVAGFQQILLAKDLIKCDLEFNAFETGFNCLKKYEIDQNLKMNEIKEFSFLSLNWNHYINDTKENHNKKIELFKNKNNNKLSLKEIHYIFQNSNIRFLFSYHPCFNFPYLLSNWYVGSSSDIEFYDMHYSRIANEYKNYYKNHEYIPQYFIDEYENSNVIEYSGGIIKINN